MATQKGSAFGALCTSLFTGASLPRTARLIASVFEALAKSAQTLRHPVRRSRVEESNHRHRRLLSTRRERPRGRYAAKQHDQVAAPHGAYPKAKDRGLSIAGF